MLQEMHWQARKHIGQLWTGRSITSLYRYPCYFEEITSKLMHNPFVFCRNALPCAWTATWMHGTRSPAHTIPDYRGKGPVFDVQMTSCTTSVSPESSGRDVWSPDARRVYRLGTLTTQQQLMATEGTGWLDLDSTWTFFITFCFQTMLKWLYTT